VVHRNRRRGETRYLLGWFPHGFAVVKADLIARKMRGASASTKEFGLEQNYIVAKIPASAGIGVCWRTDGSDNRHCDSEARYSVEHQIVTIVRTQDAGVIRVEPDRLTNAVAPSLSEKRSKILRVICLRALKTSMSTPHQRAIHNQAAPFQRWVLPTPHGLTLFPGCRNRKSGFLLNKLRGR